MRTFIALILSALPVLADSVGLGWDASTNTGITQYKVYVGPNANPAASNSTSFVTVGGNQLTALVTNVGVGITHFQATAFIGTLESLPSNDVAYTNRSFGPTNLRITLATNQTAAIWIESIPGGQTAMVEHSADSVTWKTWASVHAYEGALDRGIFLTGIVPNATDLYRARLVEAYTPASAPLPTGTRVRLQ